MKRSINSSLAQIFSYRSKVEANEEFITTLFALAALKDFKGIELDEFCRKLFMDSRLPELIRFTYKDKNKFCNLNSIKFEDKNSELTWFNHLFNYNHQIINHFVEYKNIIEVEILNSNAINAELALDKLNSLAGYSFWEVEMRSNIKKYIKNESNSKYISELRSSSDSVVVDFFLQQLLFKHQSKRFTTFSKNLVSIIDEMRDSPGDIIACHYADFYSSYLLPLEFDKRIPIDNRRLWPCTNLSCIDQYLVFKRYLTDKTNHGSGLDKREMSVVNNLLKKIKDEELESIIRLNTGIKESCNEKIAKCINNYTKGNYLKSYELISEYIRESSNYTSLVEILARSKIYLNEKKSHTIFENIANNFASILVCESNSTTKFIEIENFATSFCHSKICSSLLFHLYGLIRNNEYKKSISEKTCKLLMSYSTPYMNNDHITFNEDNKIEIPKYRKIKYRDIENLSEKEIENHYSEYEKNVVIYSDYIKDRSNYLMKNEKYLECANFIVDKYIENNLNYQFLPIKELIFLLEDCDNQETTIDIPILYTIYSKNISKNKDEDKSEVYDDYISIYDTHLPSLIFNVPEAITEKTAYFLKNVSVISNMDSSIEFESTEDIKKERVAILEILKNSKFNDDLINSERESLLDEISFDELKAKFDNSKIFVDVDAIKNEKFERYLFLYQLYQDAKINDINFGSEDGYTIIEETQDGASVVPSSNTTDVLSQIYREIVKDFVLDENYGLDKYLSADIRHGIFVSQIRSGIEKYNIITDVDESGSYKSNTIVEEKYPLLISDIKSKIIEDISSFSRDFDRTIIKANLMFTVVTDRNENKNGLFDFSAHLERINELKETIDASSNFEQFFDNLIEFMWNITIESLKNVKTNINEDLKSELITCIDKFESSITNHKRSVPLKEIFDAISLMKASVVEELDRVTSWLNITEMNENSIFSIRSVVFACSKTFESIFSNKYFELDVNDSLEQDVLLTYKEAKPLMTSVITALDNAITHGGGKVSLSMHPMKNQTEIIIRNNLTSPLPHSLEYLRELVKIKLSDRNIGLARKEGGSGLYKIFNLLKVSSTKFNLDVKITDDRFFILSIGIVK